MSCQQPVKVWLERSGRLLRLRLARPKANVLDAEMIAALGGDATTHSDTGLSPSSAYDYRVYAYNSSGPSGDSNAASATTEPPPPPPFPPGNVAAAMVSDEAIDVSWSDDSSDEDGFKVRRSADPSS